MYLYNTRNTFTAFFVECDVDQIFTFSEAFDFRLELQQYHITCHYKNAETQFEGNITFFEVLIIYFWSNFYESNDRANAKVYFMHPFKNTNPFIDAR